MPGIHITAYQINFFLDALHIASPCTVVDIAQQKYYAYYGGESHLPNSNYGRAFRYQPAMSLQRGWKLDSDKL